MPVRPPRPVLTVKPALNGGPHEAAAGDTPATATSVETHAQRGRAVNKPAIREDRRRAATIAKILGAVTELVHLQGTETLTVQAICERTGVSRGTFYRYFDSKETVLQAWVAGTLKYNHAMIDRIIVDTNDADSRLSAFLSVINDIMNRHSFRSLVQVEPALAVSLLEATYWERMQQTERVLSVVFESWEDAIGFPINRALFSELVLRCLLSTTLIPTQLEVSAVADYMKQIVAALRLAKA